MTKEEIDRLREALKQIEDSPVLGYFQGSDHRWCGECVEKKAIASLALSQSQEVK